MVGPFMQGMLLLGIIYWYSKGMMSLINDYYRTEFRQKLKVENMLKNDSLTQYDTDDILNLMEADQLVNVKEQFQGNCVESQFGNVGCMQENPSNVCPRVNDLVLFRILIQSMIQESSSTESQAYGNLCWIGQNGNSRQS